MSLRIPQQPFSELFKELADVHRGWCNYCRGNKEVCAAAPTRGCSLRDCEVAFARPEETRIERIRSEIANMTRYGCVGAEGDYGHGMEPWAGNYIEAEAVLALFEPQK